MSFQVELVTEGGSEAVAHFPQTASLQFNDYERHFVTKIFVGNRRFNFREKNWKLRRKKRNKTGDICDSEIAKVFASS